MITGKQRAYLRSLVNTLQPVTQIGKNGISQNLLECVSAALEAHELVKITVLESAPLAPREASEAICAALSCEPVQTIGRKISLYRESKDNKAIILP